MNSKQKPGWFAMAAISIAMVVGIVVTPGHNSSINAFLLNDKGLVHPANSVNSPGNPDSAFKEDQRELEESRDADVDASLFDS